jgi:hypothetical protein
MENLFHGVAATNLSGMIFGGEIHFFGRCCPDEWECGCEQGFHHVVDGGWLYAVTNKDLDLIEDEFVRDGLVLELQPRVDDPEIILQGLGGREKIVRVDQWQVVGACKPILDEDGEVIDQVEYSLRDILAGTWKGESNGEVLV